MSTVSKSKNNASKPAATRHVTHAHATETTTATEISPMPTKTKIKKKSQIVAATSDTTTDAAATTAPAATQTVTSAPAPSKPTTATTASGSLGLASLVTELSAALDAAEAQLGPEPAVSTAAAKRRTGKPRKGSDAVLTQIAPIVKQFGLESTSLNTTTMLARHQIAQTLVPLQSRLQKITKRVSDEVFGAQTDAWDMGLQFYSLLKRRAKTNGNIEQAISPLETSFSYRHGSTKVGKPTKVETRVKAQLKRAIELAEKHGVTVAVDSGGAPTAVTGGSSPAAVQAAQAAIGGSAPAAAPVAPVSTGGVGAAPPAPAPPVASANGASALPAAHS